jgi:PHD/YefM family antitoxin component YafN of YafNO toxin-antitoxin module
MFRSDQVLSAQTLRRYFPSISKKLSEEPQALLILQRGKDPLVLVSSEIFEDLVEKAYQRGIKPQSPIVL